MKTFRTVILCILSLILLLSSCYAEGTFDESPYQNTELFEMVPSDDGNSMFVDCDQKYSVANRSFDHPYDHPNYYSSITTDILIVGYNGPDKYPVLRTWVNFFTTKKIDVEKVTFDLDGTKYIFSELDYEPVEVPEGGYNEDILIKYGPEEAKFMLAVLQYFQKHTGMYDGIPVTISGSEEVTTTMSLSSLNEMNDLFTAFVQSSGLEYLSIAISPASLEIEEGNNAL